MSTQNPQDTRHLLGAEGYSEGTSLPASFESFDGMEVRDSEGDKVGTVDDVYTDERGGYVRYLAVKTGWIKTKRHMIPVDDVRMEGDGGDAYLALPYTQEQLREGPAFDRDDAITREHERGIYSHYGRSGYWDAVRARQTAPAPTPEIAEAEVSDAIDRGEHPADVAVKRWGA